MYILILCFQLPIEELQANYEKEKEKLAAITPDPKPGSEGIIVMYSVVYYEYISYSVYVVSSCMWIEYSCMFVGLKSP